jgi:hypothetical protein
MDYRILLVQIPAAPFHSDKNSLIMVASNWYNLEEKCHCYVALIKSFKATWGIIHEQQNASSNPSPYFRNKNLMKVFPKSFSIHALIWLK